MLTSLQPDTYKMPSRRFRNVAQFKAYAEERMGKSGPQLISNSSRVSPFPLIPTIVMSVLK